MSTAIFTGLYLGLGCLVISKLVDDKLTAMLVMAMLTVVGTSIMNFLIIRRAMNEKQTIV